MTRDSFLRVGHTVINLDLVLAVEFTTPGTHKHCKVLFPVGGLPSDTTFGNARVYMMDFSGEDAQRIADYFGYQWEAPPSP